MLRLDRQGPKVAGRKRKQDAACPAPRPIRELVSNTLIPQAPIAALMAPQDYAATFAYTLSSVSGTKGTNTVGPPATKWGLSQQREQDCARKMLAALSTRLCGCCGISCLLPRDLNRGGLLRSISSVAAVLFLCSFITLS